MTTSAVRPRRMALRRERRLPASVFGPVLLRALRRFASVCLSDVIGSDSHNWLCFVIRASAADPSIKLWAVLIVANVGSRGGALDPGFDLPCRKRMRV